MSVTNESVYKLSVGNAGETLKIYYPTKTKQGDLNFDSSTDICDLVYLNLIDEGKAPLTTAADINRCGVLGYENCDALRKILIK